MLIIIIMMAIFCRSELENSLFLLIVWEMLSSSSNSFYSFRSYIIGVGGNLLIIIIKLGIDTAFSNYYKCFYIFASMFYVFIQFNQRYIFEKTNRDVFLSEQNIKYEIKKIHDILSILVPSFIKDLFLRGLLNYLK